MQEIVELERRIAAALARMERGLENMPMPGDAAHGAGMAAAAPDAGGEVAALRAELAAERAAAAGLRRQLVAAEARESSLREAHDREVAALAQQLDAQGSEVQRMRKTALSLGEELHRLREAHAEGLADPALVNRALKTELDALLAARKTELSELDELTAALALHVAEAEFGGGDHAGH